jgi:hypothetical protein
LRISEGGEYQDIDELREIGRALAVEMTNRQTETA